MDKHGTIFEKMFFRILFNISDSKPIANIDIDRGGNRFESYGKRKSSYLQKLRIVHFLVIKISNLNELGSYKYGKTVKKIFNSQTYPESNWSTKVGWTCMTIIYLSFIKVPCALKKSNI